MDIQFFYNFSHFGLLSFITFILHNLVKKPLANFQGHENIIFCFLQSTLSFGFHI